MLLSGDLKDSRFLKWSLLALPITLFDTVVLARVYFIEHENLFCTCIEGAGSFVCCSILLGDVALQLANAKSKQVKLIEIKINNYHG